MRLPIVAGRFYPAQEDSLIAEIEDCFTHGLGPGLPGKTGDTRNIVAAIAPHAGYRASGMNAAHVYKAIKEDGLPEAYVIIGPDHRGVPYDVVMCSDPYLTPLGECKIHDEISKRLQQMIPDDPDAHAFEHSIEVQVPFIQYIDPDPKIIPIIMRDQSKRSAEKLAISLMDACDGYDVIVIASGDLSHYIRKKDATRIDMEFLNLAEMTDVSGMYDAIRRNNMSACGYGPSAAAILATDPMSARLLKYSDSCDSLGGNGSEVVGYGSMVFERNP